MRGGEVCSGGEGEGGGGMSMGKRALIVPLELSAFPMDLDL